MNMTRRLRAATAILLSTLIILSIAGCGKKEPKKEEKKQSKPSASEQLEKKRKAAYQSYKIVIEQNQTAIKTYS